MAVQPRCAGIFAVTASRSVSDPKDYLRKFAVADLAAMIAHAGGSADNPAVLIGHSLGGYLSLCAAIQYPRLVKALVLIATGPGFRDETAREQWNRYALSMDLGADADPAARHLGVHDDGTVIDGLGSIEVPTLVIVGSEDQPLPGCQRLPGQQDPKCVRRS